MPHGRRETSRERLAAARQRPPTGPSSRLAPTSWTRARPPKPWRRRVLERLEKAEPSNGLALFYLGAADFAKGDKPAAARRWKTLLAMLPADAPIRGMLEAKIKEAE